MFILPYLPTIYAYFLLAPFRLASASPAPTPTCYNDDGEFPPPSYSDCVRAMTVLRNSPYFTKPQTYGAYEDPPRNVPLEWSYKTCIATIDVDDGSKRDSFALSATMPAFAAVAEKCIKRKTPGQGFGGFIPIGHGKSFYAIVQYDPSWSYSAANPENLTFSNMTTQAVAVPQATQSAGMVDTA